MRGQRQTWVEARVAAVACVATDIRRIELELPEPVAADPGTHVDVRVEIGGRPDVRSYSVVETDPARRTIALTVHRSPTSRGGSVFMHGLAPGDVLRVTPPLQDFPLRHTDGRVLLLAGGIGITPLLGMADRLRRRGTDYRLVYAGRRRDAMAYLERLSGEHGDRLVTHVDAEHGRLDVAALVGGCGDDTTLYMCGPIPLMRAVTEAWEAAGHDPVRLRFETFGDGGRSPGDRFVVQVPRLGIEVEVTPERSLLEALESAGADMMYDCRKGECGLCEVTILDVDGVVDHRDVFLSGRQRATGRTLCTCVSRVVPAPDAGKRVARVSLDIP